MIFPLARVRDANRAISGLESGLGPHPGLLVSCLT